MANKQSPLHDVHVAADAKLVDFGGWDMPVAYPSGTVAEHMACRNDAAIFDVSHLGTVRVTGAGAHDALQWSLSNDLNRIAAGAAQYTHLLDADDASVTDDIIVWWLSDDNSDDNNGGIYDVIPNASNTDRVTSVLKQAADNISVEDVTSTRALLAIQGPNARSKLAEVSPEAAAVGRFKVAEVAINGVDTIVAGTGYTGEDGVEIAIPVDAGELIWNALVTAGVTPAGLGARDTLRLEAGLPLHGHELGPGITPLQAGLSWVARFDKGDFRGKAPLEAEQQAGPHRIMRGLLCDTRRPPRDGCEVLRSDERIGTVTSGNFSPVLGVGIALALLDPSVELGEDVIIDVRGKEMPAKVVKPRFVGN